MSSAYNDLLRTLRAALIELIQQHSFRFDPNAVGVSDDWVGIECETYLSRHPEETLVKRLSRYFVGEDASPADRVFVMLTVYRPVPLTGDAAHLDPDDAVHIVWKYRQRPKQTPTQVEQDRHTLDVVMRLFNNRGRHDTETETVLLNNRETGLVTRASIGRVLGRVEQAYNNTVQYRDPDM